MDNDFLLKFRSLLIQMLNAIDDALNIERTIPDKQARRRWRRRLQRQGKSDIIISNKEK